MIGGDLADDEAPDGQTSGPSLFGSMHWLRAWGPLLLGIVLFIVSALFLHRELSTVSYSQIMDQVELTPASAILLSLSLTALSFLALTGYDRLALGFIGRSVPYARVATASFVSQAIAHSTGFGVVVAGGVRYRMYLDDKLTVGEIARIQVFFGATFGLGITFLAGLAMLLEPGVVARVGVLPVPGWQLIGALLLLGVMAYLVWTAWLGRPIIFRGHELVPSASRVALGQMAIAVVDLMAAAAALYVLLPPGLDLGYVAVLGVFVAAVVVGVLSYVPGALGVFETAVVVMLQPDATQLPAVLGALVAFRAIYYLVPLLVAGVILAVVEATRALRPMAPVVQSMATLSRGLAPQFFSALSFVAGAVLLASGATPAADGRLDALSGILPHPIKLVEFSHLTGSLLGLGLILLARALLMRVASAWPLAVALLIGGIMTSVLKGLDYEEASFLGIVLVLILPCRRAFYRRTSLIAERFTPAWLVAIGVVVGATIWLTFFAFRHVEYANELWFTFAIDGEAPRSLRAGLLVAVTAFAIAGYQLLRPARALTALPTAAELEKARAIVAASDNAAACIALTGDKRFLFDDDGTAFLAYGIAGRSWVGLGTPTGPVEAWPDLLWSFRSLVDEHGGRIAFYQVPAENLPPFLDLGLYPVKLGETARVKLDGFSLQGKKRQDLRYAKSRAEREGGSFAVLAKEDVPAVMAELQAVSDSWLEDKNAREKRFSLGFFDAAYLASGPVAVVRREGRIVAFANLWTSATRDDCSIDLMRFTRHSPNGTMDYLFAEIMLWASAQGYKWFDLGMAPLSGLPDHGLAPLWSRMGRFMFRHGEQFYNFRGLRGFKQKYEPVWEPSYLLYPRLGLARVLPDIAALIAGGWMGVVRK